MDKRQIKLAHKKISSLRENINLFIKISYESKIASSEPSTTKFKSIPDINSVKAAAIDIRFFLSEDSDIFMPKLLNQLHLEGVADKTKVADFREAWLKKTGDKKSKMAPCGIALVLNDEELTLKKQIDLWINGELFHHDIEKSEVLEMVNFGGTKEISYMIFVTTLQELTRALFYFEAEFIK